MNTVFATTQSVACRRAARHRSRIVAPMLALLLCLPPSASGQIADGDLVTFEYTMTDETGRQLDSSEGRGPLSYEHGRGSLIPGLEKDLAGMRAGETKVIRVAPNEGHGPRMPQNIREVPRDKLPKPEVNAGDMFVFVGPDGQRSPVTILDVKKDTVVVDFNNPLAGKTLVFHVRIVDVEKNEERPHDNATTRP